MANANWRPVRFTVNRFKCRPALAPRSRRFWRSPSDDLGCLWSTQPGIQLQEGHRALYHSDLLQSPPEACPASAPGQSGRNRNGVGGRPMPVGRLLRASRHNFVHLSRGRRPSLVTQSLRKSFRLVKDTTCVAVQRNGVGVRVGVSMNRSIRVDPCTTRRASTVYLSRGGPL
jgi:hypothetical protein